MSDAIGALRAHVTLQSPTRVADEIGGAAIMWADACAVWAEIVSGGAGEAAAFDADASTASYRLSIRARDDVRAGWRVLWGARVLRIVGVADAGAPRLTLACTEERL